MDEPRSGTITFRIIDKHTNKNTHHWIDTIAAGGPIPVRVKHSSGALLFWGRIEPGLCTYEGDCLTTFTACSLLQFAAKLDVNHEAGRVLLSDCAGERVSSTVWRITVSGVNLNTLCVCEDDHVKIVHSGEERWFSVRYLDDAQTLHLYGNIIPDDWLEGSTTILRGELGRYSGQVFRTNAGHIGRGLADQLLARLGVETGEHNVFLGTINLGDEQSDADWTHVRRVWSEASDDVDGHGLSDFVPAPISLQGQGIIGYFLRQGRLYRLYGEGGIQECLLPSGLPPTLKGYRLFNYRMMQGSTQYDCLLIVDAYPRNTYSEQTKRWGGADAVNAGVSLGTLAAMTAAKSVPIAGQLAIAIGSTVLQSAVNSLSTTRYAVANRETIWAATRYRLFQLGGDGDILDEVASSEEQNNDPLYYTPADSVTVPAVAPTGLDSEIWSGRQGPGAIQLYRWERHGNLLEPVWMAETREAGTLAGGMAGFATHIVFGIESGLARTKTTRTY